MNRQRATEFVQGQKKRVQKKEITFISVDQPKFKEVARYKNHQSNV